MSFLIGIGLIAMPAVLIIAIMEFSQMNERHSYEEKEEDEKEEKKEPIDETLISGWQSELKKFGIFASTESLEEISRNHLSNDKNYIPFPVLFTRKEFRYLLSLISENRKFLGERDGYHGFGVEIEMIESSLKVKHLLRHLENIEESKRLLGNVQLRDSWSNAVRTKWDELEKEQAKTEEDILMLIYPRHLEGKNLFVLSFSDVGLLSEEERLKLIEEKMKGSDLESFELPIKEEQNVNTVESPALNEIQAFMESHTLPDTVKKELENTVEHIKEKLKLDLESKQNEEILENARILNDAAKGYHQL